MPHPIAAECSHDDTARDLRDAAPVAFPRFVRESAQLMAPAASSLRVAVVQTVRSPSVADTRDQMLEWIAKAAARGARVVVFSEGALGGPHPSAALDAAIAALRDAARAHGVYVITGVFGPSPRARASSWLRPRHWLGWYRSRNRVNWMLVIGPDGRDVLRYDKLYNQPDAPMPGVFSVDGVPCSAIICSDRWLRGVEEIPIQQGAKISFELANNFTAEWVEPLAWHWYVPRALRNSVWVVFANRARRRPNQTGPLPGHGHSAIVAPDGTIIASAGEEEEMLVADLDTENASRASALERAAHPALAPLWSAGDAIQRGKHTAAPPFEPLRSATTSVTLAAAPIAGSAEELRGAIAAARSRGADLVAFPARAVDEAGIDEIRSAARDHKLTVAVGATRSAGDRATAFSSAFVIGPDGAVIARHDQLSAQPPLRAGVSLDTMWFAVKGVPAVVILERDALWTEVAEMAAVAGARVIVHLDGAVGASEEARQARLQVWSNVASFLTFTATVGVGDACIWDDLHGVEHVRAALGRRPRPSTGDVSVYSAWSANLVARTVSSAELLVATRTIPGATNPHYPVRTKRYNPQMDAWYRLGARLVRGDRIGG